MSGSGNDEMYWNLSVKDKIRAMKLEATGTKSVSTSKSKPYKSRTVTKNSTAFHSQPVAMRSAQFSPESHSSEDVDGSAVRKLSTRQFEIFNADSPRRSFVREDEDDYNDYSDDHEDDGGEEEMSDKARYSSPYDHSSASRSTGYHSQGHTSRQSGYSPQGRQRADGLTGHVDSDINDEYNHFEAYNHRDEQEGEYSTNDEHESELYSNPSDSRIGDEPSHLYVQQHDGSYERDWNENRSHDSQENFANFAEMEAEQSFDNEQESQYRGEYVSHKNSNGIASAEYEDDYHSTGSCSEEVRNYLEPQSTEYSEEYGQRSYEEGSRYENNYEEDSASEGFKHGLHQDQDPLQDHESYQSNISYHDQNNRMGSNKNRIEAGQDLDDLSLAFQDVQKVKNDDFEKLSVHLSTTPSKTSKVSSSSPLLNTLLHRLKEDHVAMNDTFVDGEVQSSEKTDSKKSQKVLPAQSRNAGKSAKATTNDKVKKESDLSRRAKDMLKRRKAERPPRSSSSFSSSFEDVPMDEPAPSRLARSVLRTPPIIRSSAYRPAENISKSSEKTERTGNNNDYDRPGEKDLPIEKTDLSDSSPSPRSRRLRHAQQYYNNRKVIHNHSPVLQKQSGKSDIENADDDNSPFSESQYENFVAKLKKSSLASLSESHPTLDEEASIGSDQTEKASNVLESSDHESLTRREHIIASPTSEASAYSTFLPPVETSALQAYMIQQPHSVDVDQPLSHSNVGGKNSLPYRSSGSNSPSISQLTSRNVRIHTKQLSSKDQKNENSISDDDYFARLTNSLATMGKAASSVIEGGVAMIDEISPHIEEKKKYATELLTSHFGSTKTQARYNVYECEDVAIEVEYVESDYSEE